AASPADLQFKIGPYGKPRLAQSDQRWLQFNLSHSHEKALIAVTPGRSVGIDIEYLHRDLNVASLASYLFSPAERLQWRRAAKAEQRKLFYQYWVCKEAYLKAIGGGLNIDPRRVQLSLPASTPKIDFCD